ncbi:MAG: phage portal protein [Defluviitaleaceae bacterium]|nr:phage portal protein [Defluviitaleaceae bacterium]
MSGLEAFLNPFSVQAENIKCVVSKRFKDTEGKPVPWELRALTEDEVDAIRKSCTTREKTKTGGFQEVTDSNAVAAKMLVASVVFPNLKDAELQAAWGVRGADALARKILLAGEYTNLLFKTQEIAGFDTDINELVDDAKN